MISRNIITSNASLLEALGTLNRLSGAQMTLFVVDNTDDRHVLGTLTDGDIRRAILAGKSLDNDVKTAMHRDFVYLSESASDTVDTIREMRRKRISLAPILDNERRLIDIIDLSRRATRLPLTAILMAGGKGERLRPLTLETPKPLLKVDGKAIIDYNVEALIRSGITDITVCTRYLADMIAAHFSNPVDGVQVKCVVESEPMGTLGAAALVDHKPEGDTLIMNSDLLTTVSFEEMYLRHRDTKAQITVGVIPYQVSVPFAILDTESDRVTAIEEKPSYSYYANAGIYIVSNRLLNTLPTNRRTDAPDFIRAAIHAGARVTYHVINGTWIDIGSHTDFRQASELMRNLRHLSGSQSPL